MSLRLFASCLLACLAAGCSKPVLRGRVAAEGKVPVHTVHLLDDAALEKAARPALENFRTEAAAAARNQTLRRAQLDVLERARRALEARANAVAADGTLRDHKPAAQKVIVEQTAALDRLIEEVGQRHPVVFPAPVEERLLGSLGTPTARTGDDGRFELPAPNEGSAWIAVQPAEAKPGNEAWWLLPARTGEPLELTQANQGGRELAAWLQKRLPDLLQPLPEGDIAVDPEIQRLADASAATADAAINAARQRAKEEWQKFEMAARAAEAEMEAKAEAGRRLLQHQQSMTFIENPPKMLLAGLKMLPVQPGRFRMGSPPDEVGRSANESGVDTEITRGFLLSRTEITQAQWLLMMEDNPSEFRGAVNPVENISWQEALDFCSKLTAKAREEALLPEGWKFTLPTEAQWEYACRAGTTTALPNGRNLTSEKGADKGLAEIAWYHDNANQTTQPVGLKASNAWGFHDMLGNVWEWCLDSHGETLPGGADPLRADEGDRVIRGGAWSNLARGCRSARRSWLTADSHQNDLGFRVACVYEPEVPEPAPDPTSAKPESKPTEATPTEAKPAESKPESKPTPTKP